ncbi:MAG: beta-hexosaminidase [Lachnospiraceae bacterium]|nr:beta-hexosaminidase [Lachnospiraceae bacterium]
MSLLSGCSLWSSDKKAQSGSSSPNGAQSEASGNSHSGKEFDPGREISDRNRDSGLKPMESGESIDGASSEESGDSNESGVMNQHDDAASPEESSDAPETADASESRDASAETPDPGKAPDFTPGEGVTSDMLQRAKDILAGLSIEEKVGQMFMARFPSYYDAAEDARAYCLGGYVLFDEEFDGYSMDEVRAVIDECQEACAIPMLMSVDEEGGSVCRVSTHYRENRFYSPRYLYSIGGFEALEAETREKCELLLSLHLNMNLTPVADMAGSEEEFMYYRAFSDDPELTSEFILRTLTIMQEYGVASSLKHFPGYGSNLDTHVGMSVDERSADEFYADALIPFMAGMEAGADSVLVCHNIVTCFDSEYPASLSPEVHEVARELGYEGVLMTDDLAMGAIVDYYGCGEAAVLAVLAGNDMLISSSYITQYEAVLEAVQEGVISQERLDASVLRVLLLKIKMGLL